MRISTLTLAAAISLGAAPLSAQNSPGDFRLPSPGSPPSVERQGPVVPDVPESRSRAAPAPTPAPSPTPSPSATAAAPTDSPPPVVITPPQITPSARPTNVPSRAAAPIPTSIPAAAPTTAAPVSPLPSLPVPTAQPSATTPDVLPPSPAPSDSSWFPWWALVVALVAAIGAAAAFWKFRHAVPRAVVVRTPQVERPRLVPLPPATPAAPAAPQPVAAPAPAPRETLGLALQPLRLSLTLMNAALSYRLEIVNMGTAPLEDLRVEADMISAHASLPREQQLAGPGDGAPALHRIERLEPGESRIVEGEFRLPFPQIVPIRQGNASLLLPLARFRAQAQGTRPVVRTFAVGQPGNAGMQPFRLDLGPRVYPQLVQRAFG